MVILEALFALAIILICAELFTNGVEVFGEKLNLSQAVVGSILAAVGTALPETIIPLVAIFLYQGDAGSHIGGGNCATNASPSTSPCTCSAISTHARLSGASSSDSDGWRWVWRCASQASARSFRQHQRQAWSGSAYSHG